MNSDNKNFIIMAIALGLTAILAISLYIKDIKQVDTLDIKNFPRTINGWVSEEIPISTYDLSILETNNAFVRKYHNQEGESVYLYIVYSQNNHKATHPPEICYTGGGVSILEKTQDNIPITYNHSIIRANRLLLQDNQLTQISYYWFKVGNIFTPSYWKEQMQIAYNSLLGKKEGAALIRISADIVGNNKSKAIQEIKNFTNLITPQLFTFLS